MPESENYSSHRKDKGLSVHMTEKETADIYISISRKSPRPGKGLYIAVLEAKGTSGRVGTLTLRKMLDDVTPHQLETVAIADSLKRFRRACLVNIHSDQGWFEAIRKRGWFQKWQQDNWIVKGHRAAGADLYQEIHMLETVCNMEFGTIDKDLGSYKTWLKNEIKNARAILE